LKDEVKRAAHSSSFALTEETMARAVAELSRRDRDLARVVREFGAPEMWEREPGFASLVHIMLEQQVSLASALSAYRRLVASVPALTPENFLRLDDAALRAAYFSRQKTVYVRDLARRIVSGELDLEGLKAKPDEEARAELMKVKGIGPWTADVYLLRALMRPDAWPAGDLALIIAAERVKRLKERPTHERMEALGELWRPWRAVAARMLWQFYLHAPRASKS
jgi:DNA-3-methyladenine glycosylase II